MIVGSPARAAARRERADRRAAAAPARSTRPRDRRGHGDDRGHHEAGDGDADDGEFLLRAGVLGDTAGNGAQLPVRELAQRRLLLRQAQVDPIGPLLEHGDLELAGQLELGMDRPEPLVVDRSRILEQLLAIGRLAQRPPGDRRLEVLPLAADVQGAARSLRLLRGGGQNHVDLLLVLFHHAHFDVTRQ
jgi:hypothetical protein